MFSREIKDLPQMSQFKNKKNGTVKELKGTRHMAALGNELLGSYIHQNKYPVLDDR